MIVDRTQTGFQVFPIIVRDNGVLVAIWKNAYQAQALRLRFARQRFSACFKSTAPHDIDIAESS